MARTCCCVLALVQTNNDGFPSVFVPMLIAAPSQARKRQTNTNYIFVFVLVCLSLCSAAECHAAGSICKKMPVAGSGFALALFQSTILPIQQGLAVFVQLELCDHTF